MQCPSCPVFMTRMEVGPIELDECTRCLGMWFDKGELQRVLAEALSHTSLQQRFAPQGVPQGATRGACPRCVTARLEPREEGGHTVAGCGACGGMWLTAPVLSSLLALEAPAWEAPQHRVLPAASIPDSWRRERSGSQTTGDLRSPEGQPSGAGERSVEDPRSTRRPTQGDPESRAAGTSPAARPPGSSAAPWGSSAMTSSPPASPVAASGERMISDPRPPAADDARADRPPMATDPRRSAEPAQASPMATDPRPPSGSGPSARMATDPSPPAAPGTPAPFGETAAAVITAAVLPAPVVAPYFDRGSQPASDPDPGMHQMDALPPAPPEELPPPPSEATLRYGCAACAGWMDPVEHHGLPFHQCMKCEGAYFPRGGLPTFLAQHPEQWPAPASDGPEPEQKARCPACGYAMDPINWQGRGARVYACTDCWGTFVSASALRRLIDPEAFAEPPVDGAALFIWRVFDRVTDFFTQPPRRRGR